MKKLLEVLMTYFLTICTGVLLFAFLVFLLKCFFKAITKQALSNQAMSAFHLHFIIIFNLTH